MPTPNEGRLISMTLSLGIAILEIESLIAKLIYKADDKELILELGRAGSLIRDQVQDVIDKAKEMRSP